MDSSQGACETPVGGLVVERQVSQTNNQLEEALVMPEQLEKKNMDTDDIQSVDVLGKVQVNSSGLAVEENTPGENHETKVNGHSNEVVNGVSVSDSEAETDGSDSENGDKETGLTTPADEPIHSAGNIETDVNLGADPVQTINSVSESDIEAAPEETMGPINEATESYDIDLDKSVPELVTEYELISQGIGHKSESMMQSKTSFFSSSSSSTSSVKTSRIPVAVEKKSSTIITRQNTYTIESNTLESTDSSLEAKIDASIAESQITEDEVDASIESILKRQNTYTIKTSVSNIEEQNKQTEEHNEDPQDKGTEINGDLSSEDKTSPNESKSTIGSAITDTEAQKMPLNETVDISLQEESKETAIEEDEVTENNASFSSSEPSSQHNSSSILEKDNENTEEEKESINVQIPTPNDKPQNDVLSPEQGSENESNSCIEPVTKSMEPVIRSPIVEEPFTEKIVHKLYAENIVAEEVSKNSHEEIEEPVIEMSGEKLEEDMTMAGKQSSQPDTSTLSTNSSSNAEETQEEPESELKEELPEIVAHQENNDDTQQQTSDSNESKQSTTRAVPGDINPIKEDTSQINSEQEEEVTSPEDASDNDVIVTKQTVSLEKLEEPLYKEPEEEPDDKVQDDSNSNVGVVTKVEDQYVTAEEVRIQKHKVVVKDEIFPEEIVATQTGPIISIENNDLTKEPTILEERSLLSNNIPLMVSIPVRSTEQDKVETDQDNNAENETIRRSKDVEQLLRDIRDPNLDCSLEDIEAMIEGKELVPPKEELNRVSPEFATAATLIDQNPDKGFDPEDPAVKGIEDWECSNLNTSLESVESRSSKLKSVFKRRRSRSEERKSLLGNGSTEDNMREEEEEDDKVTVGCINSWLLYIFIKIFD